MNFRRSYQSKAILIACANCCMKILRGNIDQRAAINKENIKSGLQEASDKR